jgi:hypothetical protein
MVMSFYPKRIQKERPFGGSVSTVSGFMRTGL